MISSFIVIATVLLGLAFAIACLLSPELRRRVEQPKYVFLQNLAQYDESRSKQIANDGVVTINLKGGTRDE